MKYYHLIAGLPDIRIEDNKLTFSIADFKREVRPQLSMFDVWAMDLFFMKFDNQNLLRYFKDKEAEFDERGGITKEKMEECLRLISAAGKLKNKDFLSYFKPKNNNLPSYINTFVSEYKDAQQDEVIDAQPVEDEDDVLPVEEENVLPEEDDEDAPPVEDKADDLQPMDINDTAKWENRLAGLYYKWAMKCNNELISDWFEFNLNINNILAACAGRKYKMDVEVLGDNKVAEAIKTSKQRDFGLAETIEDIDIFLRLADEPDLFEREKKLDLIKWQWLDDQTFTKYFSIEVIFAYLIKLEIIERWVSFDPIEGGKLFRSWINSLKESVINSPELINLKKNEL